MWRLRVVIFRGLQIPTYFIFDGDGRHEGKAKKQAQAIARNTRYLRLAGADPPPFPETQVKDTWAVFRNDLEAEIHTAVGDPFLQVAAKVVEELRYEAVGERMKNTEGAARLVEVLYDEGHRLPVIEAIVDKVTKLA
jgi:hypothetical protein